MKINFKPILAVILLSVIFTQVIESKQVTVDKQFAYAEGLFHVRQYSDALAEYIKVIYLYPDNELKEKAQYKIGECFSMISNDGVWFAINEWQKLMEKYPNSTLIEKAKENIKLAKIFLQREGTPTVTESELVAVRFLRFAADFRWNSAYDGGYGRIFNAHFKEASSYWDDKVISENPNTLIAISAIMEKASLYVEQQTKKDFQLAIAEYQKIIDQYPESIYADRAQTTIGDIYENDLRNRKAALETYQKLIDRRKNDPDNYYVSYADAQIKYFK